MGLFIRAIRQPDLVGDADVQACRAALPAAEGNVSHAALRTMLALIYSRPDVLDASIASSVQELLLQPDLSEKTAPLLRDVLGALVATSLGSATIRIVTDLLRRPDLPTGSLSVLLDVLDFIVFWRPGLVDLPALLSILEQEHCASWRERVLTHVVEPCLSVGEVTDGLVNRFRDLRALDSDPPYILASLAVRLDVPESVRCIAREAVRNRFPLAERVGPRLRSGEIHILAVNNIDDAQGDEIIRVVPLLQALVDCNSATQITLLTARRYLYSHPRINTVTIDHSPAVDAALHQRFDVIIDWFHPSINLSSGLEQAVRAYVSTHHPFLFLANYTGAETNLYEQVDVEGKPWAERLGLGRSRVPNVWEPAFRLLIELGLPLRIGEMVPENPVVAAVQCGEEEALWGETVRDNVEGRPIALMNPFGGHEALKGYVDETMDRLQRRLQTLTDEGYFVVVLPSAEPWGAASVVQSVLDDLPPIVRKYVAAAPDPRQRGGSATCTCSPVPLQYHSSVMRHFLQFICRADLVVAVEGWTIHAAYVLGKPYRVLTMPYSFPGPNAWLPYASTLRQSIAEPEHALAPGGLADCRATPPLEERPRALTLRALVRELGETAQPEALPPLRFALQSKDRKVRLAAVRALGRYSSDEIHRLLLACIEDSCCEVRAAAARTLLESGVDWSGTLGPSYRGQFQTHMTVGELTWDWGVMIADKDGARIALERALHDDYASVRRLASNALRLLDYYRDQSASAAEGLSGRQSWRHFRPRRLTNRRSTSGVDQPSILILTPLKDAEENLGRYQSLISSLSYPHERVSLGFLESDSSDRTYAAMRRILPDLRLSFRRVDLWKHDFHYRIPPGHVRGDVAIQMERRSVLAQSRNRLLEGALRDEDWVLWLDVDVNEYQPDIIDQLLARNEDILTPHCVLEYGGRSFDRNAWRDRGALHLEDLRDEGEVVPLHAVGATMLLVRADIHRQGLRFPASLYGAGNPLCRDELGEIETEGLAIMAQDMGYSCSGMPRLEIRHRDR